MPSNSSAILSKLQQAGYKQTKPRLAVAQWITTHKGIFSAKELIAELPGVEQTSVYRTVQLLEELDLIHPVLTNHGEKHYEAHEEDHHHHVVCTSCEKSVAVECEVTRQAVEGFSHLHHSVVFTGLCEQCVV